MEKLNKPYVYAKSKEVRELHKSADEAVKNYIKDNPGNAINLVEQAHNYGVSVRNAALIVNTLKEKQEAVKTYDDWAKDGLAVRKGQKAISIIEPRTDEKGNIAMTKVSVFPTSATNAKKNQYDKINSDFFSKNTKNDHLGYPTSKQFNKVSEYYHLGEVASEKDSTKNSSNKLIDKYFENRDGFVKSPNEQNTKFEKELVKRMYEDKTLKPASSKDSLSTNKNKEKTANELRKWTTTDGKHFTDLDGKAQAKLLSSSLRTFNKLSYSTQRAVRELETKNEKARQVAAARKQEMERA